MRAGGARAWFGEHGGSLALVVVCLSLTAGAAWQAHLLDAQRYAEQFRRDAALWGARVVAPVQGALGATRAAARKLSDGPVGEPEVAGVLVASELERGGAVDAAGWMPVPPDDGSPAGFTVHVFARVGGLIATVQAPGVWSREARAQLRWAARAGTPTLVWLAPGDAPGYDGLLVAVPVATLYGGLQAPGIAFGVIGSTRLTRALREEDEGCPLVVELEDPLLPGGTVHRFEPAPGPKRWLDPLLGEGWRAPGVFASPGEGWWAQLSPTPAYRAAHTSGTHWSIALMGALLTGALLVVQYFTVRPTQARLQRILAERAQREQAERVAREAAERLQASERKYRELVQHANSAILRLSRDGHVTFVNEFGQRFFGWSEEELVGRPAVGTIVPATESGGRDLAEFIALLCAAPDAHVSSVNENACKDGRRVWVSWTNKAVFDEAGELVGVFCVGSDVTEQRQAEEALRRARDELELRVEERTAELSQANVALIEENEMHLRAVAEIRRLARDLEARAGELAAANARLQELDRLKSEFLATMSHELRTPLNSIIGFTGILRAGMAGPLTDEQGKQLGMVYGSATHLLSLINDLLDLSRIEAGRIELDLRPYDLRGVVAEVEASCRPAVGAKGLAFRVELPDGAITLVGDRKRCYQVLLNLASNAVKFTERGEVRVSAAVEGGRVRVTVADTGIGIREEHLGMLFEAFRQVDGSARRVYEGTGLGLYLCRKLLGLMGGEIAVESVHGQGSRFSFTLPLRAPAEAAPEVRA